LERAGLDHGDFFVRVMVFRVRHLTGGKGGDVEIDFVGIAIVSPEHVSAFVVVGRVRFHLELGEVVALGGQRGISGSGRCFGREGKKRGKKKAEVAAGKLWL
jgi:hypothetical protein